MAIQLREIPISPAARADRLQRALQLPVGALVLGAFQAMGAPPVMVVKGDTLAVMGPRYFSAVRAGVDLNAREDAGTYIGSFHGHWLEDTGLEIFHLFEVAGP